MLIIRPIAMRASIALVALCGACTVAREDLTRVDLGVEPMRSPLAESAAFRDTIGSFAYYEGLRPMIVRGYGLVVGLGKNGSADCPREVRDRLLQSIYKQYRFTSHTVGDRVISPERMIDDLDTAVVIVQGQIPPAAAGGSRFDVAVLALPGTQTKSLRGGRLYTAELDVFNITPSGPVFGRTLARAAGPLFINPFGESGDATRSNPLEASIPGGATVIEDRRVRLVLGQPSYNLAQRIQDRVNAHFPGRERVADAISPSFVQIRVPEEFRDDSSHFLALVRSLYLSRDPAFEQQRAQQLAEELSRPDGSHAEITLALEGLGRRAIPVLSRLYESKADHVTFHAAAAGLRLDDHVAVDVMSAHAADPNSRYRMQAIRALRDARGLAAASGPLRKLLDDEDSRVRIAAYEALVARNDPTVVTTAFGGDSFALDSATSQRGNLIHLRRANERRIGLIGRDFRITPPLLYRAPDGSLMIDGKEGEDALSVVRVVPSTNAMSPPVRVPPEVPALLALLGREPGVGEDETPTGFGMDYASVARAIQQLCRDGAINAEFVLEQPNLGALLGPNQPQGRPESEL